MDFDMMCERVKDILATDGETGLKDADVAKALGISPNAFYGMRFRDKIPYEQLLDFLHKRGVSINLFFYGQAKDSKRYKMLRMFDVNASLGTGAINQMVGYESVVVDKRLLGYFKANNCDIIQTIGDSMQPSIQDGDLCLIDRDFSFKNGNIYAINSPDGLMIKQCYIKESELLLISHNPIYTPATFSLSECEVVGRVVGVLRQI